MIVLSDDNKGFELRFMPFRFIPNNVEKSKSSYLKEMGANGSQPELILMGRVLQKNQSS